MHNSFTFMIDIPVFRSLLPAEMELLKKNGTIKKYPPRSIIQTEGQSATFFAVMTKGLAKAVLFCEDGREILLHFYKPGDFFGEMNLSDIRECPFSIISAKPCEFLLMDIDVMVQLIRKNGNFAYSLFSFVSKRLNRTQKRLRDTIYERGEDRILKYFEDVAAEIGIPEDHRIRISAKISHQVIADTCGFSRETVSRHISQLQKNGVLCQTEDGWIMDTNK